MTIELSRYGKVLRRYKAFGSLRLETKDSFQCSFDAVQFNDGAIRVQCYITGSDNNESNVLAWDLMSNVNVESITGITEDNQEIELTGQLLWTNVDQSRTTNSKAIAISLVAAEMLVKPKGVEQHLHTVQFGVTNFDFEGNVGRKRNIQTSHAFDRRILTANLPVGKIRIERIPNYEEAVANLTATRGIEPTCEILLELSKHDIQWAKGVVDNLCTLLSLARGTKIVWIYLNGYSPEGVRCLTIHRYAVTRPYSGASACVVDSAHPDDTKELIEKGYERFLELNTEYKLGYVIDAYLESKRPHSFLEAKGLAAIQAMELLAGEYAARHDLVFVIDETEFAEKLNDVGPSVRKALEEAFGEGCAIALCGENNEKLRSLNRQTLNQVLKRLFHDSGLEVRGKRLHALIQTRNALVHKGSFNTNDKVKEYYRTISIMDRLLLRMLGYEGYILDCENKWHRVKL